MSDLAVTLTVEQSVSRLAKAQMRAEAMGEAELRRLLVAWAASVASVDVDSAQLAFACEHFTFNESHVVYLVQSGDVPAVKIGMSRYLPQRVAEIQVLNPQPVRCLAVLPGGAGLEAMLHYQLRRLRMHGEWFCLGKEILALCAVAGSVGG